MASNPIHNAEEYRAYKVSVGAWSATFKPRADLDLPRPDEFPLIIVRSYNWHRGRDEFEAVSLLDFGEDNILAAARAIVQQERQYDVDGDSENSRDTHL